MDQLFYNCARVYREPDGSVDIDDYLETDWSVVFEDDQFIKRKAHPHSKDHMLVIVSEYFNRLTGVWLSTTINIL